MRLSTPAPNGWLGLPFGATSSPYSAARPHRGQDWGWYYSNPDASKRVYSNSTGVVTRVHDGYVTGKTQNDGWGNGVEIQISRNVVSKLWHFNKGTIQVREGQLVTPEMYIGPMGNSGWTNGQTHLHEELWIDGVRVDPQYYRTHDIPGTGSTAGGDAKPFNTEKPKEWDEMATKDEIKAAVREVVAERTVGSLSIVPLTEGGIFLFSLSTGRRVHISSVYHVQIIQRAIANNSNDVMLPGELDIVSGYITAVNPPVGVTVDAEALAKRLAELDASDDAATIKAAVKEAISQTTFTVKSN